MAPTSASTNTQERFQRAFKEPTKKLSTHVAGRSLPDWAPLTMGDILVHD